MTEETFASYSYPRCLAKLVVSHQNFIQKVITLVINVKYNSLVSKKIIFEVLKVLIILKTKSSKIPNTKIF